MYHQAAGASAVGVGTLAATGFDSLWLGLAGFALVAAGAALVRIVPKRGATKT